MLKNAAGNPGWEDRGGGVGGAISHRPVRDGLSGKLTFVPRAEGSEGTRLRAIWGSVSREGNP